MRGPSVLGYRRHSLDPQRPKLPATCNGIELVSGPSPQMELLVNASFFMQRHVGQERPFRWNATSAVMPSSAILLMLNNSEKFLH